MSFELTEKDYCKFELNCVLSSAKVQSKKEEVLKQFSNAPCPGFRKGKASREAILTYYKSQVEESLKRALAEDAFHDGIFEKELRPIGTPNFSSLFIKDGKFYCTFTVDVRPTFELKNVRDFTVPNPHFPMTVESLLNEKLEELRNRFGETSFFTENDFVNNNDTVILSYESFLGDEKIESMCATSEVVEVGKSIDKDFSDNLLGMKLNEEREFVYNVKSGMPSLVGKDVKVKAVVSGGTKTTPCSLDDELAKKLNMESFEKLKEHVNKICMSIVDNNKKKQLIQSVSNLLVESHDFKVQDWLVNKEAVYLSKSAKLDWDKLSDEDKSVWLKTAEKNVKLSLVLDKVREVEPEAQLTDQEVLGYLKRSLANQLENDSNEALAAYLAKMGHYSQVLFAKVKDEYALEFVLKNVKVVE